MVLLLKKYFKFQLITGAFANIAFGAAILFIPDLFDALIQFDPTTNELFRLFVSGVAIGLGIGYVYTFVKEPENLSLLIFGMGLKYWAFAVTLYCFLYCSLSLFMFIIFGIGNLLLAMAFSMHIYMRNIDAS